MPQLAIPKRADRDATPLVLRDDADGVATLTLNRPQARNALSSALMAALHETLEEIAEDPSPARPSAPGTI